MMPVYRKMTMETTPAQRQGIDHGGVIECGETGSKLWP
jgi:hypothetical protein